MLLPPHPARHEAAHKNCWLHNLQLSTDSSDKCFSKILDTPLDLLVVKLEGLIQSFHVTLGNMAASILRLRAGSKHSSSIIEKP